MKRYLLIIGFIICYAGIGYAQKDSIKTLKFVKISGNDTIREKKLVPHGEFVILTNDLRKTKIKFKYITIIDSGFYYNRKDVSKRVKYNMGDTILFKDIKLVYCSTKGYILRNLISIPVIFISGPGLAIELILSTLSLMNPLFMIPTTGVFIGGLALNNAYKKFKISEKWKINSCYYKLKQ